MVAVVLFVVYSAIRSMFYGSCGIICCIFSNTQYVLWQLWYYLLYIQQYAVCFMVAVVLFVVYSAIRSMFYGSCGIGGLVRAEVNVNSRRHCSGRVWDVNLRTCDAHSTLTVSLPKCRIYEGQSDIIPSVTYEGRSDTIPSVIYEGRSDTIPSVIYEGRSDTIPSVIYEGWS